MPRLVGQRSNAGFYILPFILLVVVAGGALQYLGFIDVPGVVERTKERFDQRSSTRAVILADGLILDVERVEEIDA